VSREIEHLQRDLHAVGALLADPQKRMAPRAGKASIGEARIGELEALIDRFDAELPTLHRFILSGGNPTGAALHVARTICRRAERRIVSLGEAAVDLEVVTYINRLSDLLFTMARLVNHRASVAETEW
jgi:cob(I)alamin adenosyltransferase